MAKPKPSSSSRPAGRGLARKSPSSSLLTTIFQFFFISLLIVLIRYASTHHQNLTLPLKARIAGLLEHRGKMAPTTALLDATGLRINGVPYDARVYWMRRANGVLEDFAEPCPFAPFGTVVVNHSAPGGWGELVCMGLNGNARLGDPTLHGEIAAIQNCSKVLTDPKGRHRLSPQEALAAFAGLSLYTNAESCPMCASAIRWANFKEYIYGTSIDTLVKKGWGQIHISSHDIFKESYQLPGSTRILAHVLANETDPYFLWQFNASYPCPDGCSRASVSGMCEPS